MGPRNAHVLPASPPCVWVGGQGSPCGRHAGGCSGRWLSWTTSPLWSAAGGGGGWLTVLTASSYSFWLWGVCSPTPVYPASAQDAGFPGDVCFESEGNLVLNLWGDRIPHLDYLADSGHLASSCVPYVLTRSQGDRVDLSYLIVSPATAQNSQPREPVSPGDL